MWKSIDDLLHLLETELQFLDRGGYRDSDMWRPQFIFLDSPSCANPAGAGRPDACKNCLLMPFVPVALRHASVPCYQMPLTTDGLTADSLQRWGTQQELEDALRSWLTRNIEHLKRALVVRNEGKLSKTGWQATSIEGTDFSAGRQDHCNEVTTEG